MNPFDTFLVWPILNVLLGIYNGLLSINFPYPLGFAIIGLTIVIRFVLYPLISAQIKASKKMQDLNPHLHTIKEKHKGNSTMISQETMRLYKEHGVNPAAGCLPVIVQLPIIFALYSVLQQIVSLPGNKVVTEINQIVYFDFLKLTRAWDSSFFGLDLGKSPADLLGTIGPVVFLIPIATGVFQFLQSKMMFPSGQNQPKKGDFASAFATQSTYIFPIMIGFFSYTFPIGLSLYWNTFTIFGIIQQHRIAGPGGLLEFADLWKKRLKVQ